MGYGVATRHQLMVPCIMGMKDTEEYNTQSTLHNPEDGNTVCCLGQCKLFSHLGKNRQRKLRLLTHDEKKEK